MKKRKRMTKKTEMMYSDLQEIKEGMAKQDQFLERFKRINDQNHNVASLSKLNNDGISRSNSPRVGRTSK